MPAEPYRRDDATPPATLVAVPDTGHPATPDPARRIVHKRSSHIELHTIDVPATPRWVRSSFVLLGALVLLQALHQVLGWGGDRLDTFIDLWCNNLVLAGAAGLTGWRAVRMPAERAAWACITLSLLFYCTGDVVWSAFFADSAAPVTVADAFYLCFAPLAMVGVVLLVRSRISHFRLERWIDGVAAALLIATPAVVLILEPTIRQSDGSLLAKVVSVSYPASDIVLLGAVIGVIALSGWHPGRAWMLLALGCVAFVTADSIYAVQNLTGTYALGNYDFLWPLAGLLIAAAAWVAPVRHERVTSWGWQSICLPVICQLAPIALVVLSHDAPSEQLMTIAVLVLVIVQIVVTRPRRPSDLALATGRGGGPHVGRTP